MPRSHFQLYRLTRRDFERYITDADAQHRINETVQKAQELYRYASFNEAFDALRDEVYAGPPDPVEPSGGPVTEATFTEAITDNEAAGRIIRIVDFRRLSNPQYTDRDLRHELMGTGRSVEVPTDAQFEEEQAKVARANLAEGRTAVQ
jgi:hypothetical protein